MPQSHESGRSGSPRQAILELMSGYWKTQAIAAAAELGIADLLKDGPRTAEELARATHTHAPSLYRLLRALASVSVFAEDDGRFRLTQMAECLLSVPGSQRSLARMMGGEHYRAWGELPYSIRTGRTAFEHVYGKPIFHYLTEHPESAAIFDDAMTGVHGWETAAMLAAYDFSSVRTLVDVGGGNGTTLAGVLGRYPAMKGILFDRADVVARAAPALAGLADRCTAVGGDFFQAVPAGGDAYLLRHIIHDWDDEKSRAILQNCRQAMGGRGKLLIVESVIPPGNDPFFAKFLDLSMLVLPGGQERTEAEYRSLYEGASFRLSRIVRTQSEISVIEGEPA